MNPFLIALVSLLGVIGYIACGAIVTAVVAANTVEESTHPLFDQRTGTYVQTPVRRSTLDPFVATLTFLGWPVVVAVVAVAAVAYVIGYVFHFLLIAPLSRVLNKAIKTIAHRLNPNFDGWTDL